MARRQTAQAGGRVMRSHCADRSRAPASAASARGLSPRKPKVVPDPARPGMWRVRWPDGRLSDMTNLTRAKDAITCFIETEERRQRGRHSPLGGRLCVKTGELGARAPVQRNGACIAARAIHRGE
jgi:hypothetical protein